MSFAAAAHSGTVAAMRGKTSIVRSKGVLNICSSALMWTGSSLKKTIFKEPLIKSFLDTFSDGFSSVGNDGCAFNQRFLNETKGLLENELYQ